MTQDPRWLLEGAYRAALAVSSPFRLTRAHLPPSAPDGVLAVGKAAAGMLEAALERFPGVPFLAVMPAGVPPVPAAHGQVIVAGHPLPDAHSVRAGEAALTFVSGLPAGAHLLVLLSGGGSALLCAPWGVTLAQKRALTAALLSSGADITHINTVRKHLSRVKGGQLAAATRAHVTALLLSDVVGDDPGSVVSGPTVPDSSTFGDALAVLDRFQIDAPEARAHLRRGGSGELPETPKPGGELDARRSTTVIGSGRTLLEAAQACLAAQGVPAEIVTHTLSGEAQDAARRHAAVIRRARQAGPRPRVLLSGGETTVTLAGAHGTGGRNHEFALALLLELGQEGVYALSAGSDGVDGTSGAAGAFLTPGSLGRAVRLGLDPQAFLARHDSGAFFAALGDQLVTGPSGTNLNDVQLVWVE